MCSNKADFITEETVKASINAFGPMKAAGMDELPPCVFQHFGELAIRRLVQLYKASYLLGHVPLPWREAKAVFIPKVGKSDYAEARSFRPITLSTFMIKIMERVILWHINQNHLKISPLSDNQHAFRSGRSTETALTSLVTQIEEGLEKKEYALGVFLDIQGAFDNVSAKAIERGMRKKGLPESLIKWYCHYVGHRRLVVDHNGIKVVRYLTRGTPQGGVLSPVIWNLVFEDFLALFEQRRVTANGFADDGALMILGENPHVMMMHMQLAVNRALEWGKSCELNFSPEKTVVVLFTRKYKPDIPQELRMGEMKVPFSSTVKYLGVTLDKKLSWKAHIDRTVKAAKFKLMRVRNAMGKLWGINPLMMRWLYTGCIRPAISYAALVWAQACQKQWVVTALKRVNRLALTAIGHFRRSTPTAGLEIIMHVRPLDVHIQFEACLALNRTSFTMGADGEHINHKVIRGGHREYCSKLLDRLNLTITESDKVTPTYRWRKLFELDKESFSHGKPYPCQLGTYEVYTDGSGQDGKFGSGTVVFRGPAASVNIQDYWYSYLGEEASVFQGEVYAIKSAANWLAEKEMVRKNIIIYSDSRAALLALNQTKIKSKLVLSTRRVLDRVGKDNTVVLRWVKAHVGHFGNEFADELAKKGAEGQRVCADAPNIPESMIKSRFRNIFDTHWQDKWAHRGDCRQTKQWMPRISRKISYNILGLGRKTVSWLVQLITGHNFMKRHESLVNGDEENMCRLCLEEEETSFHVMAECPALARPRLEVFGTPFQRTPLQWTTKQVVSFVREASIDGLLDPAGLYGSNAE